MCGRYTYVCECRISVEVQSNANISQDRSSFFTAMTLKQEHQMCNGVYDIGNEVESGDYEVDHSLKFLKRRTFENLCCINSTVAENVDMTVRQVHSVLVTEFPEFESICTMYINSKKSMLSHGMGVQNNDELCGLINPLCACVAKCYCSRSVCLSVPSKCLERLPQNNQDVASAKCMYIHLCIHTCYSGHCALCD